MEQFHVGPVSVYRRSFRSRWSVYWRNQGQRYRKTLAVSNRKQARAIATDLATALTAGKDETLEQILCSHSVGDFSFDIVLDAFEAGSSFTTAVDASQHSRALSEITVGFDGWQETTWQGNHSIRKALRIAFGNQPIRSLSVIHIEKLLQDVERKASPATRNRYLATINTVLKWAQRYNLVTDLITTGLRPRRVAEHVPVALDATELDLFYANLRARELPTVKFLHDTGLRIRELANLHWQDVDLPRGLITIRENKSTKLFRTIPLTQRSIAVLREHQSEAKALNGPVHLYPYSDRTLREELGKASLRAGIRHVHPHLFRHTFATELIDEGVPVETIQKLLGHKTIGMTLRYAKKRGKGLEDAIARLSR